MGVRCSCRFGGEGLWSVAEEAFLPRGAFGGIRLERLATFCGGSA